MATKRSDEPQFINGRRFLGASVSAAAVPFVGKGIEEARAQPVTVANSDSPVSVALSVNGQAYRLGLDVRTTLLDILREHIGLTGSKKGCDHGQCGACTAHIDGVRVLSCLTLAITAQGHQVSTVEDWRVRTDRCIRCSRPLSITTPSNAAIARRARSCPPSAA
jgi:xanthine dehydrogenase YagT iron-sulfur-binding subunit